MLSEVHSPRRNLYGPILDYQYNKFFSFCQDILQKIFCCCIIKEVFEILSKKELKYENSCNRVLLRRNSLRCG